MIFLLLHFDSNELIGTALRADMPAKQKNTNNPVAAPQRPSPPAVSSGGGVVTLPRSAPAPLPPEEAVAAPKTTSASFKAELLATLREEMVGIFKSELKTAMTDNFTQVKSELQSVKAELKADMAAIRRWICLS